MGQLQRIQSVYLLLAAFLGAALFLLPVATAPEQTEGMLADGVLNLNDHLALLVLTIGVVVLSFVTIFLYNNRILQMNLGKLNMVLTVGLLGLAAYLFSNVQGIASIGVGLFLPVVVLVFLWLANRNINKDERLVRDSDRLR